MPPFSFAEAWTRAMSTRLAVSSVAGSLAPLRTEMSEADVHRLTLAIRSATGIEAFVWLVDVAGLSRDEATELMRWSARALLRSALADTTTDSRD